MTTAVDDKSVMNFMRLAFAEVCQKIPPSSSYVFSVVAESFVLGGTGR